MKLWPWHSAAEVRALEARVRALHAEMFYAQERNLLAKRELARERDLRLALTRPRHHWIQPEEKPDMKWPTVAVVLFTYNRREYAQRTLEAFFLRARYSGNWHLHIADDGSDPSYSRALQEVAASYKQGPLTMTSSNSQRGGYGASYNLATQKLHDQYQILLPLEDDWELTRYFDFDPLVRALMDGVANCIRMGYVGWTQELRGRFVKHEEAHLTYLELDGGSPETHVFAGHPRLETRWFERSVGPWPEGIPAGETEMVVANRPEARVGVVWPCDLIHPRGDLFAHIGTYKAGEVGEEVAGSAQR